MTVHEMIERLQEIDEDGFGECELRLAFQPSWPLQFRIGGIATPDDALRRGCEPDEPDAQDHATYTSAVYIVEGGHPRDDSPYAPDWAFAAAE